MDVGGEGRPGDEEVGVVFVFVFVFGLFVSGCIFVCLRVAQPEVEDDDRPRRVGAEVTSRFLCPVARPCFGPCDTFPKRRRGQLQRADMTLSERPVGG